LHSSACVCDFPQLGVRTDELLLCRVALVLELLERCLCCNSRPAFIFLGALRPHLHLLCAPKLQGHGFRSHARIQSQLTPYRVLEQQLLLKFAHAGFEHSLTFSGLVELRLQVVSLFAKPTLDGSRDVLHLRNFCSGALFQG